MNKPPRKPPKKDKKKDENKDGQKNMQGEKNETGENNSNGQLDREAEREAAVREAIHTLFLQHSSRSSSSNDGSLDGNSIYTLMNAAMTQANFTADKHLEQV